MKQTQNASKLGEIITISMWEQLYKRKAFTSSKIDIQRKAGWRTEDVEGRLLKIKTKILGKRVIQIINSPKLDKENTYLLFESYYPKRGRPYDSFSIHNIEDDEKLYWITPNNGNKSMKNKAQVFSHTNSFIEPIVEGVWKDVVTWFMEDKSI